MLTVNLYLEARRTAGKRAGWDELQLAIEAGSAVIACVQAAKLAHHWLILTRKSEEKNDCKS